MNVFRYWQKLRSRGGAGALFLQVNRFEFSNLRYLIETFKKRRKMGLVALKLGNRQRLGLGRKQMRSFLQY